MTPTHNAGRDSFVLLHIGERRFALPASRVTELAPPVRLHKFPHTSARVSGVIVRRGKIVPVCDPRVVFGGRAVVGKLVLSSRRMQFWGRQRTLRGSPSTGNAS